MKRLKNKFLQMDLNTTTYREIYDGVSRPPKMCLCLRIQVPLPRKRPKKAMTMLSNNDPCNFLILGERYE